MSGTSEQQNANEISLQSALIQATENGDVGEVKRLIDNGIAVDEVDSRGMNALFVAVGCRNENLVRLLIEEGEAFVNARDLYGRTALFYAITQSKGIAGYLIQKGADVNPKDFSNRSALSFFVENCMMTENTPLSSLLSFKSDEFDMLKDPAVDVKHEVIKTILNILFCKLPLMCASSKIPTDKINQETIEKIRENFMPALEEVSTYFEEKDTTKKAIVDDISRLCEKEKSFSAMCDKVIASLVKIGADPNFADSDGNTALHYAAFLPFLGVSKEVIMCMFGQLESYGLTLNTRNHENQNPLLFCLSGSIGQLEDDTLTAMKTLVEVCKFLVTRGSSLDETTHNGESVFHLLINLFQQGFEIPKQKVRQEVVEEMKKLLFSFSCDRFIKGSTVNKGDACLKSPLHHWAELTLPCPTDDFFQATLKEILEHLLRLGATPNARNEEEETPLHMCKTWSAVKLLLQNGANPKDVDSSGCPPIIAAVNNTAYFIKSDFGEGDKESVVRKMIDAGADVNTTDDEGKTALFYAVQDNNESVVRVLIDAGADVNVKYLEGRTVLFMVPSNITITEMLIDDGSALVNARDVYGRTPLFYAMTKSLETASLMIDKGARINVKDNCNVSILSFLIEYSIKTASEPSAGLNLLREKGIKLKTIFKTLVSVVFCCCFNLRISTRFGEIQIESLVDALETATGYIENEDPRQQIINEILTTMKKYKSEKGISKSLVPKIITSLVKVGADPNTADSEGNTALHYTTRLVFEKVSPEVVKDTCENLIAAESSLNTRNHRKETPILFGLSERFLQDITEENTKEDLVLTQVYGILFQNGSTVDVIEKGGNSFIHLVLKLFQRALYFDTKRSKRAKALGEVAALFQLCCEADTAILVTINRRDAHLNSPLHLWSMLKWNKYNEDDWEHVNKIWHNLLKFGAKLNARNENDETALHLCTTWRAAKLLIAKVSNLNDVESSGRKPLLSAALRFKERMRSENPSPEAFYEDASLSPYEFWKSVFETNLDPWAADKYGQTVMGVLVESEAYVLAKTLVEAAIEMKLQESDNIAASLLNAICKDRSRRVFWKCELIEYILKARRNPIKSLQCNGETPLHCCCRGIIETFNSVRQKATNLIQSSQDKAENPINDETSVHWTIAKQLIQYGADCTIPDTSGQSCLDIAKACPELKKLLSSPLDINKVPLLIPWTKVSKRHQPMLAKVARRQECEKVQQYWYHKDHLASGSFGSVFAGINEKDGREVAIKRIEKLRLLRPEDRREIKSLTVLADCEQVVLYLSFLEDENFCYIILELMEGNLKEYIESPDFDEKESVKLCQDVLKGLNFMHSHKILHRDLNPSNILYKCHPKLCLKIADFGLSRGIDSTSTTVYGTNAETSCWVAPEVLKSTKYEHSTASDMFSCGLVLHYLLSKKKHPFSPADCDRKSQKQIANETETNVINGNMEGWVVSLTPEATNLVRQLLETEASKRPTAEESLAHPLFRLKMKTVDLLSAASFQPKCSLDRISPVLFDTANELEMKFDTMIKYKDRYGPRFEHGLLYIPTIYAKMRRRGYDDQVEFERLRNICSGVSNRTVQGPNRKGFAFFEHLQNILINVYKALTTAYGWHHTTKDLECLMKK